MSSDRSNAVSRLVSTLLPLIPGAQPWATALAASLPAIRALFKSAGGGNDADFDALIAEARKGIARLADPDSFRKFKPVVQPPPATTGPYNAVLLAYPDRAAYLDGDEVWQKGEESEWAVFSARLPGIGKPPAPWHLVETFE